MKFAVKGADKKTGEEREIQIDAGNENGARIIASNKGLLVEAIRSLEASAPPIPYESARAEQPTDSLLAYVKKIHFWIVFWSVLAIVQLVGITLVILSQLLALKH